MEATRLSGTAIARAIRARRLSSLEAVDAHIQAIERVNLRINAVVAPRFEEARDEARRADAAPRDLPFWGVPCTVKECYAVAGMPWTSGLASRVGAPATQDAPAVARLRAAGAIILGLTNTSELCMWYETNNTVYGRTKNPYDPSRIVGGSSGGEGAVVGAGASPFGLGSDIGGSIRMPAFFCGAFGHKPSGGLVPTSGQFPPAEGRARFYLGSGPISRFAEDLEPLTRLLAGPDGEDGECVPMELHSPPAKEVLLLEWEGVHPDLRKAQEDAARALGLPWRSIELPAVKQGFDLWAAALSEAGETTFRQWMGDPDPFRELTRWARRKTPHTLPAIGLAALETLETRLMPDRVKRFAAQARAWTEEVDALLTPGTLLLCPPFPRTAPRHHWPLLHPGAFTTTAVWNLCGVPATTVPLGLDPKGLPLGVQVIAARGHDPVTLAAARRLESELGGWVPPRSEA